MVKIYYLNSIWQFDLSLAFEYMITIFDLLRFHSGTYHCRWSWWATCCASRSFSKAIQIYLASFVLAMVLARACTRSCLRIPVRNLSFWNSSNQYSQDHDQGHLLCTQCGCGETMIGYYCNLNPSYDGKLELLLWMNLVA